MAKKQGTNQEKPKKILRLFKFFGTVFLVFEIFKIFPKMLKRGKLKRFINNEKRELKELATGDQDVKRFWGDSLLLLQHSFIPSDENDHRPKVLRPRSLVTIAMVAIVLKLMVTGFLFATYPNTAQLAAIVSGTMIDLTNQSRAEAGLSPLQQSETLTEFARVKGQDMIDRGYFSHDTPEGKRPWEWIDRSAYDYVYAGENLAMDFVTAEVVHDAFMKSPSHRRNILNPRYQDVGIAVLRGELNGRDTILLINFFGSERANVAPIAAAQELPRLTDSLEVTPPDTIAGVEVTDVAPASPAHEGVAPPILDAQNEGIIVVTTKDTSTRLLVDWVIEYSNIFFIAFLIFMLISLALNVFVKIQVQHTGMILQSSVVIALLIALLLVKFHFVEQVAPQLLIL